MHCRFGMTEALRCAVGKSSTMRCRFARRRGHKAEWDASSPFRLVASGSASHPDRWLPAYSAAVIDGRPGQFGEVDHPPEPLRGDVPPAEPQPLAAASQPAAGHVQLNDNDPFDPA